VGLCGGNARDRKTIAGEWGDFMTPPPEKMKLGITIRDMPAEYRPQARLISEGTKVLSDAELLSLIIKTGSKMENAINLCQRMLSQFDLKQLSVAPVSQSCKFMVLRKLRLHR